MTAINHALTGAVIGLMVSSPLIAVPAALLSHFICDALPHYASRLPDKDSVISKSFQHLLQVDIFLCFLLALGLSLSHPRHWLLAIICAFAATLPDVIWLPGYLRAKKGGVYSPRPNLFMRVARQLQWFQRPPGAIVEVAWALAMGSILVAYL